MRRFISALSIAMLIASGVTAAYGQDKAQKHNVVGGTSITISGEADMTYVYRDSVAEEVSAWTLGGVAGSSSDNFYSGKFTLRLEADLPDNAKVVIELENKRIDGGANSRAGSDALGVEFEQAYLQLKDFFDPRLSVKMGVQDIRYDLRGNGDAFFLDVTEAESAFSPINGLSTTNRDTLEPVGISTNYKEGLLNVDFFVVKVSDTAAGNEDDESLAGLYVRYALDQMLNAKSSVDFVVTWNNGGSANGGGATMGKDQRILTFGTGANLMDVAAGLDLFGEVYFQSGDAGVNGAGDTLDAGGMAFELGGKYTFNQMAYKPWVELSYWSISGDDDAADSKDGRFVSYENVDDFLIVESNDYGLDVDTNYSAIKFHGGVTPKDDVSLTVQAGFFKFEEDTRTGNDDKLGTEVDVKLKYSYSKNVTFNVTVAALTGANALEAYTVDQDNDIRMFLVGTNVKF